MIRILALVPVLVALAACGKEAVEAPADDRRGAEGEVLGGTITDAMLPLPTVRSQSPPLETAPATEGPGGASKDSGERQPAQADESSAEPETQPEAEATPAEAED